MFKVKIIISEKCKKMCKYMLKPLFMDEKIDLKLSDSLMVIEVVTKVMFRLICNKLKSTVSKNFINIAHLRFTTTL